MDRWTDHQNFAAAGEQREEIASVHRAAIRSIQRVVSENATPHDEEYASAGIAELLKAGKVLVLTGAGVSTESGIPDYRGPGGSLHDHRPMTYQEFRYDDVARQRYWARSYVGWRRMRRAEPNRAHYALAELEQLGAVSGVTYAERGWAARPRWELPPAGAARRPLPYCVPGLRAGREPRKPGCAPGRGEPRLPGAPRRRRPAREP